MKTTHGRENLQNSQGGTLFTPDKIIIDGTEQKSLSDINSKGNRTLYEVRIGIGSKETIILLPFGLFYMFGSLAMLRDRDEPATPQVADNKGFVHRNELKLEKSIMNQYVYRTRTEIYKQARELSRNHHITLTDCYNLTDWPVIENGAAFGRESHWRLAADPDAIVVSPKVADFPDAVFNTICIDWHKRRGLFS